MSFTAEVITEPHGNLTVPKDPCKFGRSIEYSQPRGLEGRHKILFNKGRYFETSFYNKELLDALVELTGFKVQYNNMIVQSWKDMEDFVIAMNILGYRVEIDIDWI